MDAHMFRLAVQLLLTALVIAACGGSGAEPVEPIP